MVKVFKKSYHQDLFLLKDRNKKIYYVCLIFFAIILPLILGDFLLGEMALFLIWSIGGMSLMILVGHTGLASLGHAAFSVSYTHLTLPTKA